MPKSDRAYNGVEYGITDLGGSKWKWAFYPKKEGGLPHRGEITGAREVAKEACMSAIDEWLRDNVKTRET